MQRVFRLHTLLIFQNKSKNGLANLKGADIDKTANGNGLNESCEGPFLTLEGELNKLAANISIGRR